MSAEKAMVNSSIELERDPLLRLFSFLIMLET